MNIRSGSFALALLLGATLHQPAAIAAAASTEASAPQTWTALGGDLGFIWNVDLLNDVGITLKDSVNAADDGRGFFAVPLRDQGGLSFSVTQTNFEHFVDGRLTLRGGFRLNTPNGELSLVDATLQPRASGSQILDIVGADGSSWFYLDRLMYVIADGGRTLDIQTMDLRMHEALANRLGKPQMAGQVFAQMRMRTGVLAQNGNYIQVIEADPVWPNTDVPGVPGAKYLADVFMSSFTGQYSRCAAQPSCGTSCPCDGPAGATDGHAVFTPSSTLRNNVNNGTPAPTVSGDPLGTSTALYTADVAWYRKFTAARPPYDNDQHPNLIWNLYRVGTDGRIEQIGRSGVKHAFVTTNGGCSAGPGSGGTTGAILGRSCSDTYGAGNNDSNNDLGPRNEIVASASSMEWGRCGSIFDPECDLTSNTNGGNTNYSQRMIVRESQLAVPGTLYFESWYLVRDDINIYNTMSSRPVTITYPTGGPWFLSNGSPHLLGPAINRWISPTTVDPNERNVEVDAGKEGRSRIAVRATDLGGGRTRFDYAVMNFDFVRAYTEGTGAYADDSDPTKRFRVIHNFGFDRFSVPLPAGVDVDTLEFNDGDLDTANNWTVAVADGAVTWSAPVNPTPPANTPAILNGLNWGTMFRFSFVADGAVQSGVNVDLHVAQTGTPASFQASVIGPMADAIFVDDFEEVL